MRSGASSLLARAASTDPFEALAAYLRTTEYYRHCDVIFDGKNVPYINSTGLGTILRFMDMLQDVGGNLVLSQLSDKALMVIEMLGFASALDIVEDNDSAVTILKSK